MWNRQQIEELKEAGCEKLFQEQVSSVGKRAQLTAALEFVREDDVLVVTKLDQPGTLGCGLDEYHRPPES